jgi:hypothetical protein
MLRIFKISGYEKRRLFLAHIFVQQRILRISTLSIRTPWTRVTFPPNLFHDSAPSKRAAKTSNTASVAFMRA